ncbi:NADH dehydrogenase (ubiquinone) subunit ND-13B [Nomia melanderi]|uniref:NADH dehydrogenase (ubiquinone) subunit ND-13B n=1 Tax=Nomia melanderi TaxID=2448451 RepID=UPI0013045F1C|nr:NADH dehydrogenase [ubiquinone] 1 alpha subcomplex subunit 5 [Nomia melanderi]
MAQALKKTTGITGLAVCHNPHIVLTDLYARILRIVTHFPEESAYKRHTMKLVQERDNIVRKTKNVADIEEKIGCGQVEELIIQAKNELSLAEKMRLWKPWESLVEESPPHQWDWPPHK